MALEDFKPEILFKNPEEELLYLRQKVKEKESELIKERETGASVEGVDNFAHENLEEYKKTRPENILDQDAIIKESEINKVVLKLSPEEHDNKMAELLHLLQEKGVKNTLSVVHKMKNPHIEDDFHRFLVEYLKEGYTAPGLKEKSNLSKSLRMTLYEVSLPNDTESKETGLKELLSSMEQFYSGMLSVNNDSKKNNYFSIEIAVEDGTEEIIIYLAVPDIHKNLFEKQLYSVFPNAQIVEKKDDYNIFVNEGVSVGASLRLEENPIFPLKTYEEYSYDPLNIVLNAFSKIEKVGGGAALQVVIKPKGDYFTKKFSSALDKIKKGTEVKKAIDISYGFGDDIRLFLKELVSGSSKKKEENKKPIDEKIVKEIEEKIKTHIVSTNIRIVASAKNKERAESILGEIESVFNQFENSSVNKFRFSRYKRWGLSNFLRSFSYREFSKKESIPLNLRELTSIIHLPSVGIKSSPQFKQLKSKDTPAPIDLPQEGTFLGINKSRGNETNVYLTKEDRLRHFYVVGQTGTGKTTILKNMIIQDIKEGEGVCWIDPHGHDIEHILANIPEERFDDVIYFDPGYTERAMALNMLEYDPAFPEQKTFVVNELFSIFQKLYGAVPESMGPMFEQYFRNAAGLVLEDPESGNTLLDVSRVLADAKFRELKLQKSKNPVINQFWREIATKAGGEGSLQNIVPYITSKFDVFLANEIMRPIVAQQKSAFDFRKIMDERKILLVNLSKGRLGDINSNLIGLILVGKILISSFGRSEANSKVNPFYLYIDEFHNFTTDSISTILSEARKYKLSLNVAHQHITQLDEKIKNAVFGNVGSMSVFRVGSQDAEFLSKQFEPVFTQNDLISIDNFNAYIKMLANGAPVKPFNIRINKEPEGNKDNLEKIKMLSYMKYGRPRKEVEEEILKKYQSLL